MKKIMLLIASLLLLVFQVQAQVMKNLPVVIHTTAIVGDDGSPYMLSLHENELVSMTGLAEDGELCMAIYGTQGSASKFVAQGTDDPVPSLKTSWCDAQGVTHEVVTPIVSQTEGGIDRAHALHEKLVAKMQAKHPPRPCPP